MSSLNLGGASLIGVKDVLTNPISKKDFLLFDRIAVPLLSGYKESHPDIGNQIDLATMDLLFDKGLAFEVELRDEQFPVRGSALGPGMQVALAMWGAAAGIAGSGASVEEAAGWALSGLREVYQLTVRATAEIVEAKYGIRSAPLLSEPFQGIAEDIQADASELLARIRRLPRDVRRFDTASMPRKDSQARSYPSLRPVLLAEVALRRIAQNGYKDYVNTPVLDIVLDSLPLPDESVSWEQILEFRSDPRTNYLLHELRKWMRDLSTKVAEPKMIREEMEYLVAAHNDHMAFHKLKARPGKVQVLLTIGSELVDSLADLKISQAFKALGGFRERRVALLEAEREAPGREIAYVIEANERFGRNSNGT